LNPPAENNKKQLPHAEPDLRLLGAIDENTVRSLQEQVAKLPQGEGPLVLELTSNGGEADSARRLAQDIRTLARKRELFLLGKSYVYSAGITAMAAVPASRRFLTRDTMLLIHERRLERTVQLSGALRSGLVVVNDLLAELESGRRLEREGFEELVAGSTMSADALLERVLEKDWYLGAKEALELGLVAGLVD
jgi:ATP-dependent Clp protease protease subunit